MQYRDMRRASVQAPNEQYWPAYAFPLNWASEEAAAEWTDMTVSSGSLKTSESSDFRDITAGVSGFCGLWSGGGEFGMHEKNSRMSKETSELSVSFKYARVQIARPWLTPSLLKMKGWELPGQDPGSISTGTIEDNDGQFPLLPTAMIVVRGLRITPLGPPERRVSSSDAPESIGASRWP